MAARLTRDTKVALRIESSASCQGERFNCTPPFSCVTLLVRARILLLFKEHDKVVRIADELCPSVDTPNPASGGRFKTGQCKTVANFFENFRIGSLHESVRRSICPMQ